MPSKSKRNRRQISQNRRGAIDNVAASQAAAAATAAGQDQNAAASYNTTNISARAVSSAAPVQTMFLNDLKWIGVVTAIIVILLIASYFIFR